MYMGLLYNFTHLNKKLIYPKNNDEVFVIMRKSADRYSLDNIMKYFLLKKIYCLQLSLVAALYSHIISVDLSQYINNMLGSFLLFHVIQISIIIIISGIEDLPL